MRKSLLLTTSVLAALLCCASIAEAQHQAHGFLSKEGIDFLAKEAKAYVPSVIEPPTYTNSYACVDFEQSDTKINLNLDRLEISVPTAGRIRVDADFSGSVSGEMYFDGLYLCIGEVSCPDTLQVRHGKAVLEYEVTVINGRLDIIARELDFSINPEDAVLNFDCGFTGDVLSTDMVKGWLLGFIEDAIIGATDEHIGPMVEDMLGGMGVSGSDFIASFKDIDLEQEGVSVEIDAYLGFGNTPPSECVAPFDNGGPQDFAGAPPNLKRPDASHLNMALNLGLANAALYAGWHRGVMCLTEAHIKALGVEIPFESVGALLPGFPEGTEFSLDLSLQDYPRISGDPSIDAALTMQVNGIVLDLHGDRPDGTRNTLHAEIGISSTVSVGINPATNAIFGKLDAAEITHLVLEDERKATGDGFDVARIKQLAHDYIIPKLIKEMGAMDITGPTFAMDGYAMILRDLTTNDAFLSAGVDLFKIPETDTSEPDTLIVSAPKGITNPHDAVVKVTGTDEDVPTELLQYLITINGEEQPLSFVQEFKVGEMGKTLNYDVVVAAIDFSGNVDSSPATATLVVDGIAPRVVISGRRTKKADEGPVDIRWTLKDDLTTKETLAVRVDIFEIQDTSDALSTKLIESRELALGATQTTVELNNVGGIYRVEVHAIDEAGNDSQSSMLLTIASKGGCSVGGDGPMNTGLLMLLALGFLAIRRRQEGRQER